MSAAPDARVVLRARGVLESADLGLRFLAANGRAFARLSFALLVPGWAASMAMHYVLGVDWFTTWFASLAVAVLLEGPFTVLSGQVALRRGVRIFDVLQAFSRRAFLFMVLLLVASALQIVSVAVAIVPWLFVAPMLLFLPEIVLLEGSGSAAFRRGTRISAGQGGRALGITVLLLSVRLACVGMADATLRRTVGLVLDVHARLDSLWTDGGSPYALAGLWLSVPLCAALRYIAYIDLRTLREGWDVQRRFQVLATRLSAEAGT